MPAEWAQNPVPFNGRVGSIPTSGILDSEVTRTLGPELPREVGMGWELELGVQELGVEGARPPEPRLPTPPHFNVNE